MPMVALVLLESLAGGFALAAIYVGVRSMVRRRRANLERRRLAGLGTVEGHREYPR